MIGIYGLVCTESHWGLVGNKGIVHIILWGLYSLLGSKARRLLQLARVVAEALVSDMLAP